MKVLEYYIIYNFETIILLKLLYLYSYLSTHLFFLLVTHRSIIGIKIKVDNSNLKFWTLD